jgi:hypothetical protein
MLAYVLLESKIEFAVSIQHLETFGSCVVWTLHGATLTVDISRYIFLQLFCVYLSSVAFTTVPYELRYLQRQQKFEPGALQTTR